MPHGYFFGAASLFTTTGLVTTDDASWEKARRRSSASRLVSSSAAIASALYIALRWVVTASAPRAFMISMSRATSAIAKSVYGATCGHGRGM